MDAAVQSDDYVYAILSTNDVSLTGCHRYEFNNQTDTVIQTSLQLSSKYLNKRGKERKRERERGTGREREKEKKRERERERKRERERGGGGGCTQH